MKKVYVADDDPGIAGVIKFSLEKLEGVQATFFDNGLDLYRQIQQSAPDGLITDIILPKLDGLAIVRLLKFHELYQAIPIMIISSITDPDIEELILKIRADDFLRKPFRPNELRMRVSKLLGIT